MLKALKLTGRVMEQVNRCHPLELPLAIRIRLGLLSTAISVALCGGLVALFAYESADPRPSTDFGAINLADACQSPSSRETRDACTHRAVSKWQPPRPRLAGDSASADGRDLGSRHSIAIASPDPR